MTNFDRYRLLVGAYFLFGGMAGAAFLWRIVVEGGSPVTEEVYGPWVYRIPAWFWCVFQMLSGWVAAFGALTGRRWVVAIGGACFVADMAFLAAAGYLAGGTGAVLHLNATFFIGPISALMVVFCYGGGNE